MAQQHPSDVKIPGRYIGSCAICLHAMNANSTGIDQVTVLRCGHYFHTCCYNQAVRAAPEQKCPACRKDLTGFTVLPADGPTIEQQNHQRGLQERKTPEDYVKDRVETLKQQIQKAKNESKIRAIEAKEKEHQRKVQLLQNLKVKLQATRGIPCVVHGNPQSSDQAKVLKLLLDISQKNVSRETDNHANQIKELEGLERNFQEYENRKMERLGEIDELKMKLAVKKGVTVEEIDLMMEARMKERQAIKQQLSLQRQSRLAPPAPPQNNHNNNNGNMMMMMGNHNYNNNNEDRRRARESNEDAHQQHQKPKNSASHHDKDKKTKQTSNNTSNNSSSSELMAEFLKNEQSRQGRTPIKSQGSNGSGSQKK